MKRYALLLFLALVTIAPAAHAGMWKLQIFSDVAMTDSTISDNAPRIVNLYVVEIGSFWGATGVRFSTEPTAGFTGVWLGDSSAFVTVGNTQTDLSVGYGACIPPPIVVVTMSYQLFGTSEACSQLRIVPADNFRWVISGDVDCFFAEGIITDLGNLHVNCPVAVEPTTWGAVKALYR